MKENKKSQKLIFSPLIDPRSERKSSNARWEALVILQLLKRLQIAMMHLFFFSPFNSAAKKMELIFFPYLENNLTIFGSRGQRRSLSQKGHGSKKLAVRLFGSSSKHTTKSVRVLNQLQRIKHMRVHLFSPPILAVKKEIIHHPPKLPRWFLQERDQCQPNTQAQHCLALHLHAEQPQCVDEEESPNLSPMSCLEKNSLPKNIGH